MLRHPERCERCTSRSCASVYRGKTYHLDHRVCEKNLSVVTFSVGGELIVANGFYVLGQNNALPPAERKQLKQFKVSEQELSDIGKRLPELAQGIRSEIDSKASELIAGLHDIKTRVNLVFRNAESIVQNLPGADDFEKIEAADPAIKRLLKSVNLLRSRLEMTSLISNPESANYGQLRPTPVYKVFDKMVRLFEQTAAQKSVGIVMQGNSFNRPYLYDSFETIPLILIDNAIKYSRQGSTVAVKVMDDLTSLSSVLITVTSWGSIVPERERAAIFERGYRGTNATATASGSGLGLYIAGIVASAHNTLIEYSCQPSTQFLSEGYNTFGITIASVLPKIVS